MEEAFGLMEPHRHQPSPASHHCLYISCTFQKKVSMDSVSSRLLTVFCLFFGFHLVPFNSFPHREFTVPPNTTSSQTVRGPWALPHLAASVSILPFAEQTHHPGTWQASQVKCWPACCLFTSSAPSFLSEPSFSRPSSGCSRSRCPWRPARALVWELLVTAQKGASRSDESTRPSHSLRAVMMPRGFQHATGKSLQIRDEPCDPGGCGSLPTDFG